MPELKGAPLALPLTWEEQELSTGYSSVVYDANGTAIDMHLSSRQAEAISRMVNSHGEMLAALKKAETWLEGWASAEYELPLIRAAIDAAEGKEADTPDATDAPKAEPAPVDFEQRRDGWLIAFIPISSSARQWSIDAQPKGARWEHERWYAKRDRAPAVRHAIEAEGFTVREV